MHNLNHRCFMLPSAKQQIGQTTKQHQPDRVLLITLQSSLFYIHWCPKWNQALHRRNPHYQRSKSYLFLSWGPSAPAIWHHRGCSSQKPGISWRGWHRARIYLLRVWTISPSWTHGWAFHSLHFWDTKKFINYERPYGVITCICTLSRLPPLHGLPRHIPPDGLQKLLQDNCSWINLNLGLIVNLTVHLTQAIVTRNTSRLNAALMLTND